MDQRTTAREVLVQSDGKILIGGDMQIIEESSFFNGLVRLNPDGSRDTFFDASVTGTVRSIIAIQAGAQILVGGSLEQADGVPRLGLARYIDIRGVVNHDGSASLADAIIVLQVLADGTTPPVYKDGDVNNDDRIGLAEAIYLLQKTAETRW